MDLTPFHGPPAAPPEVPGFKLYELLGFGAHGEVWRAEDLITGADVALKIGRRCDPGPDENPDDGGGPDAFFGGGNDRETALLSRIEHPHIVRLRRVVPLPDENLALVLDLAAGGSLAALVAARGPLTPEEVVTMAVPIVSALEHLHRSGLTHGDVSPGNLLFTADGCPQLGDLGVARVLGERYEDAWSTPGFTDPRLIAALESPPVPADVLRAADLWALAACCWFALTGRAPNEPQIEGQPHELQTMLARSLSADADDRPDLAEFADLAWRAAQPVPIRLERRAGQHSGHAGPPLLEAQTTRRVTRTVPVQTPGALNGLLNGGEAQKASAAKPPESERRTVPASRLLLLLVAIGLVGVVTAGVGWRLLRGPSAGDGALVEVSPTATGGKSALENISASSGAEPKSSAGETKKDVADKALRLELQQALSRIGQARARAFEMVSVGQLAQADEPGSPADRADRALLKRLQATGYRLEDVAFQIERVRVLQVKGRTVQVSALVSTAAHRQVRVSGGYAAGVPATEPGVMVFTLRAVGAQGEGTARWRVRDIRAKT